jgi:hypothetical protein
MIVLASGLLVVIIWIASSSLWMQQSSLHYQWTHHKKWILWLMGILALVTLQAVVWKKIENKDQPTSQSS